MTTSKICQVMEGSVVEDRISGLPESILGLILSFVPVRDAARTAATCKSLNHVWNTLPFLDMGSDFFPVFPSDTDTEDEYQYQYQDGDYIGDGDYIEDDDDEVKGQEEEEASEDDEEQEEETSEDDEEVKGQEEEEASEDDDVVGREASEDDEAVKGQEEEEDDGSNDSDDERLLRKREKLVSFLDQTLVRRREQGLTIHKFRLSQTQLDGELRRSLDRWIRCLVECKIKDLLLRICISERHCYDLPGILFTATSLFSLTLRNCRMPSGVAIALSSLRILHLEDVYLDDQFVKHLVTTCRDLEDLTLDCCPGIKGTIDVSGQSKLLRVLELYPHPEDTVREIVVEAQYLESLSYTGGFRQVRINLTINFEGCLKYLLLYGADITNEWFCKLISKLPCLEELWLAQLSLKAIEISSSSLKRLSLSGVFDYKGNTFGEFTVNAPNLVCFRYSDCLTPVFLTSVVAKEVFIDIEEVKDKCTPEQICSKLMQLLNTFDYSEVVTLNCSYFEHLIFPPETRSNIAAPLAHIKHLVLKGRFQRDPVDVLPVLFESLRWISPNMCKLSFKRNHYRMEGYPIDILIPIPIEVTSHGGIYPEVSRYLRDLECHYHTK